MKQAVDLGHSDKLLGHNIFVKSSKASVSKQLFLHYFQAFWLAKSVSFNQIATCFQYFNITRYSTSFWIFKRLTLIKAGSRNLNPIKSICDIFDVGPLYNKRVFVSSKGVKMLSFYRNTRNPIRHFPILFTFTFFFINELEPCLGPPKHIQTSCLIIRKKKDFEMGPSPCGSFVGQAIFYLSPKKGYYSFPPFLEGLLCILVIIFYSVCVCGLGPLSLIFCNFPAHLGPVRFQVIKHF